MRIKFLSVIVSFLAISFAMSSCLDNDNTIEYGTDPTIHSFSINDIETDRLIENGNYNGTEDTTIVIKLTGANYPFTIDQLSAGSFNYDDGDEVKTGTYTGAIFNKDSLPVGTNIKKVVINMSVNGYVTYNRKNISGKDSLCLWSSTDSLDFTNPIYFSVYAQDPTLSPKIYQAKINVHKQYPDSLEWKQMPESNFAITGEQRAVLFNNNIFVYSANAAYQGKLTQDGNITWEKINLSGFPAQVPTSLIAFNGNLYATNDNTKYYTSDNGIAWSEHIFTEGSIKTFLGVSKEQLLAAVEKDGKKYSYALKANEWISQGELSSTFPTKGIASVTYPLKHNTSIDKTIILSNDNNVDNENAVCWALLSNSKTWTQYSPSSGSSYNCPRLDNLAFIHYNNELYAFGGKGDNAFKTFYISKDEGIIWKEATNNISIPKSFQENNKNNDFSYVVDDNNFIWIMWSNSNEVWRGRINKLGFVNKM